MEKKGTDPQKTVISARVDRRKLEDIRKVAKRDYRSLSNFIAVLIDKFLFDDWDGKRPKLPSKD